ncbi:MAG: GerW family sporulation protein [Clostridium sp.]|jgi:sporulation protein ytfJ|nr:GerW family sporulation protein [Clostridium sp.]
MNSNHQEVENLMKSTMESLRNMIDVNTVVGDTVKMNNGNCIIPISKVTFGFASGGSDFSLNNENYKDGDYPFGGGTGAGVSVKPVAFLVVRDESVRLLPVEQNTTYDRIVDTVPQVLEIIKDFVKKKDNNDNFEEDINTFESSSSSYHLNRED